MSQFSIFNTPLSGLRVIKRKPISDERGFLTRLYCHDELCEIGWDKSIKQINHTLTKKIGTVRGIHFQNSPHAEIKLVSCIRGKVWDVAVDVRKGSPTFLHWHAEILSFENSYAFLIPEGFAHGFQTLTDDCELLYLHSAPYVKRAESGIRPDDPALGITWPCDFGEISERDSMHPLLNSKFIGVIL